MSKLRCLLAALALTGSLSAGCSSTRSSGRTVSHRPVIVQPAPVDPAPIDRDALHTMLAKRRDVMVTRFLAYRDQQVYPVNTTGENPAHVWIDPFGNLCAAATIISGDWGRDATVAAVGGNNGLRLADVHDGALHDWILTSGLTHHELVAIQAPGFTERQLDEMPLRTDETRRLYAIYVDVERQLRSMWDQSLEDAVDELMARPDLARKLLADYPYHPGPHEQATADGWAILPS